MDSDPRPHRPTMAFFALYLSGRSRRDEVHPGAILRDWGRYERLHTKKGLISDPSRQTKLKSVVFMTGRPCVNVPSILRKLFAGWGYYEYEAKEAGYSKSSLDCLRHNAPHANPDRCSNKNLNCHETSAPLAFDYLVRQRDAVIHYGSSRRVVDRVGWGRQGGDLRGSA